MRRRDFLATLAATAAAFPVRAAAPASDVDVVVVGAGMAGLTVARALLAQRVSVTILEARDRIGGRAWTDAETFGRPIDLGCSWLHASDENPLVPVIKELGFQTVEDPQNEIIAIEGRRGRGTDTKAFDMAVDHGIRLLDKGSRASDVAASAVLKPTSPIEHLAYAMVGPFEAGVDLDTLSAADQSAQIGTDQQLLLPEGLGTAVARFGAGLPVRLSSPVTTLRWLGPGVAAEGAFGRVSAQVAVVTVPLGVLAGGGLRFDPPLPARQQAAIAGLPMGLLNKVVLQFAEDPFDAEPMDDLYGVRRDGGPFAIKLRLFGSNVAVALLGGSQARELERRGDAAQIDYVLDSLSEVYGRAVRDQLRHSRATRWASDPFSRGSYSAALPGHLDARNVLNEPLGFRLFFAGEALDRTWATQLAGAHVSGLRTAQSVLAVLGKG